MVLPPLPGPVPLMAMHMPQVWELKKRGESMATLKEVPAAQGRYCASENEKLQVPDPWASP